MKKKRIIPLLLLLGLIVSLMSFLPPPPPGTSDYEQNPPRPTAFWVQVLPKPLPDGSNMKIFVKYEEIEPMPLSLEIYTSDVKTPTITLTDDGTLADSVAGDSVYTGYIKEDITGFESTITSLVTTINKKPSLITFTGHLGAKVTGGGIKFDRYGYEHYGQVSIDPYLLAGLECDLNLARQNSLFITDLSVVEDLARTYNVVTGAGNNVGIYTFGSVMSNIANTGVTGIHPKDLIKSWLKNYTIPVTVNGQTIGSRPYVIDFLIAPWLHKAGVSGTIDLSNWETLWDAANETEILYNAPFKLTAIVNRIDLRGNSGYSPGLHNTGETRFIFSLVDPYSGIPPIQCNNNFACLDLLDWKGMNIIFEFGNVQTNICQVRSFAQQWLALSSLTLGSADYNSALENITRSVLNAGAAPGKVNGSAINRIRTNERIFDNTGKSSGSWMHSDWEFRQFQLDPGTGLFVQVPLTNTPVNSANATFDLSYSPTIPLTTADQNNLINWVFSSPANIARVHNGTHSMPNTYGGLPLTSGGARVDAEYTHFWDLNWQATASDAPNYGPYIPIDPNSVYYKQVRQQLSINTCSGCHNGESKTVFTQVMPMGYGTSANYWTTTTHPDYTNASIDERFASNSGYSVTTVTPPDNYPPPLSPDYMVRVSAFLTGRNYRSTSTGSGGNYYDDNDGDADDNTLDGLFYVFSPDNDGGYMQVNDQIFGYNDLLRRQQDLCRLIGTDCNPRAINVMAQVSHIPLPVDGH